MVYQRTAEQRRHDLANAKAYENYVADAIGVPVHSRFTSKTDLDLWHPGYFIEIKEKNQPLTPRWHILEHCEERNLFVLDELTVRKALRWYPEVFLLVRDNSGGDPDPRLFLIPIWELIALVSPPRKTSLPTPTPHSLSSCGSAPSVWAAWSGRSR